MKTVFDNRQLAHIWAAQGQATGRNASGSMYFKGDTIYSYGSHYAIARIYNNGKTGRDHEYFALLNTDNYSNSTVKQRSLVVSALTGRMNRVFVPNPSKLHSADNEDYLLNNIAEIIDDKLNMRRGSSWKLSIDTQIQQLNDYYSLAGIKKTFALDEVWRDLMREALATKEARNQTKIQRWQVKENAKVEREIAKYAPQVPLWQSHENTESIPSHVFGYDYVRLTKDKSEVETSRGARVPIDHALRVLRALSLGQSITGTSVGGFTIDGAADDSGLVKIGCHKVNINQARAALSEVL